MRILMHIVLVLGALSCACSKPNKPKETKTHIPMELILKRDRYISQGVFETDKYGWSMPKCDGLLFNSLAAYSGFPTDPMRAEKAPGLWQRHPAFDCMESGASRSTISKDMFRGLFIYLYGKSDIGALERIEAYGKEHSWVMGEASDQEAYWGRVIMSPSMSYQLSRMIRGGPSFDIDERYVTIKEGFEGHLDVLGIYLDGMIDQGISEGDLKKLGLYATREPSNALYQAVYHRYKDGDQSVATALLLNTSLFPQDRLRSEHDQAAPYLWQRDEVTVEKLQSDDLGCIHYFHEKDKFLTHECGLNPGSFYQRAIYNEDWLPCGEKPRHPCEGTKAHAPTDFIFALRVIEGR